MIIWGSKGRIKTIAEGQFLCPRCRAVKPYIHKQIGKYFTLYFIPLFQTENVGEYLECQSCFTTFDPKVLNSRHLIEEEIRMEHERKNFMDEIARQLDAGLSIQIITAGLKKAGVPDNSLGNILYTITNGEITGCDNCHSVYKSTVQFCPMCGSRLPPPTKLS